MIRDLLRNPCAPTLALLIGLAGAAKADPINPGDVHFFDYSTSVGISNLQPGGSTVTTSDDGSVVTITTPGNWQIDLTGSYSVAQGKPPGTPHLNATSPDGTTISFGDIAVRSGNIHGPRENISLNFSFTLTFTDYGLDATGGAPNAPTGSVTVSGLLRGTVGDGLRANLDVDMASFTVTPTGGVVPIGANLFRLDDLRFAPPEPGQHSGRFTAHLSATPEPGSLALIGLGGAGLAVGLRRRRRAARVA